MTISVIIPTHNRPKELLNALKSIYSQSLLPQEIIVIDDGSKIPIDIDIFEFCPPEINCLIIRNEIPKGACHARNLGIFSAKSKFIAFLDDDDEFFNHKLEIVLNNTLRHPDIDVFYHKAKVIMPKENIAYLSKPYAMTSDDTILKQLVIKNCIGGTSMVIARKSSLEKVGGFNEDMESLQDYDLWLRLAISNNKFHYIPEPLTKYAAITNDASISKSIDKNIRSISKIEALNHMYYENLSKCELKDHAEWKLSMLVHKSMMSYKKRDALKYQLKLLIKNLSIKNLIMFVALLIGIKFTFKIKGALG